MESTAYLFVADLIKAALHPRVACTLLVVVALMGFSARWWKFGSANLLAALGLAAAAIVAPFPDLALNALEHRFPVWGENSNAEIAGIVVIGGDGDDRLVQAARLAQLFPTAKVVYSTGGGAEARDAVLSRLARLGIPAERAAVNTLSHNTAEDASGAAELARPQAHERWMLVTSASHMPRAVASFRAVGFTIEAYPISHTPKGGSDYWLDFSSGPEKIHRALKEYVGLIAYRLLGRSVELFPKGSRAEASL